MSSMALGATRMPFRSVLGAGKVASAPSFGHLLDVSTAEAIAVTLLVGVLLAVYLYLNRWAVSLQQGSKLSRYTVDG